MNHVISKPEAYGCAGFYGNKYWVAVPAGSTLEEIEGKLRDLIPKCRKDKVVLGRFKFYVNEITFFVHFKGESVFHDDPADFVYEWMDEKLVKV